MTNRAQKKKKNKQVARPPYVSRKKANTRAKAARRSGADRAGPVTVIRPDGTKTVQAAYDIHQLARVQAGALPGGDPFLPQNLRMQIAKRDKWHCRYCGALCGYKNKDGRSKFEIDHVEPRSLGGKDTEDNLVLACKSCNQKKGAKVWTPTPLAEHRRLYGTTS